MSTIGDRIRNIRKSESMTMDKFGERLGVSKSAISEIENGRRNPSNQLFNSICREFNVNPSWLQDGSGEMFVEKSRNDLIEGFIGDILANEPEGFRTRLITAMAKMDEKGWESLERFCRGVIAEAAAAEKQHDTERDELHQELDRQLDLQDGTRKSPESSAG